MNKKIYPLLLTSTLIISNASDASEHINERAHNEELIGVTSGIVLGAVVAGPVGAIIGAFTGVLIGKSVGDDSEIDAQDAKIAEKDSQIQMLSNETKQLVELKQGQAQQLTKLGMRLTLPFTTGSSELARHIKQQLDDLAYAMSMSPELTVELTGYADRRGDSTYNQALSEQRVAEVKSYLVAQGVDNRRLTLKAFGANAPLSETQNTENDFFDRRVNIQFISSEARPTINQ
ncbi:sortase-associated OmpA-like protein PdsO [Shewanella sp. VB17]|uniref:sortase-associated OmpA-like protein PdsO n=1 Tax=Shewanella sp. VB17 TaxID=2739432 RepID=UPI001562EF90|nr:sortase-associated OmpA-like protein PdsO [Shewanella sp. VB17]NRD73849.1 sortase-associated OmpA-like protein PdsO [Shewanella sp. VB17]